MRLIINHETVYRYATPARSMVQHLRLTPRDHEGQRVLDWHIDLDHAGRLVRREDAFGNILHMIWLDGPLDSVRITVSGEVETEDCAGIVRSTMERLPVGFYLRETALTHPDQPIRDFAEGIRDAKLGALDLAHALMQRLREEIAFEVGSTSVTTGAAEAFKAKRGVCQDLTHIFIASARLLGLPARYVAGYLLKDAGPVDQEAGHAWAEVHIPDLGWVGFDAVNNVSPTESYVRVASGPDYLAAAPVRGARFGGDDETMEVRVRVEPEAQSQRQGQGQGQGQQSQSQG